MASAADDADSEIAHVSETRSVVDARIGQIVGGTYRITRHIGSGGSSHVFSAEHVRLGKAFAVKLLRTELDSSRRAAQRFRREAKAIARLKSEHIVSVIDCGELEDQTPYLVMELLEGEDLRSLLKREGSLPAGRAVEIVIEACRGLTVVHEAGLVHRDLKPENLFITRRASGEDWCKVLDFGVAKMEASLSTAQGAIIGTVRYMAPEQLSDVAAVGPATDVYALGAVLYECLSGRSAQSGETVQEVMFCVMHKQSESLSVSCPALPEALVTLVSRCLAKRPSERIPTPAKLAALLADSLRGERAARLNLTLPEDESVPVVQAAQPARPWLAGGALVLAALAGAAVSWSARPNQPAPAIDARESVPTPPAVTRQRPTSEADPRPISAPKTVETGPSASPTPPISLPPPLAPHPAALRRVSASVPVPAAISARSGNGTVRLDQANPYGE